MPGVGAIWAGKFPDYAVQQELCACLLPLAEASHQFYADFFNFPHEPIWYDPSQRYPAVLLSEYVFDRRPPPAGLEQVEPGYFLAKDVSLYGLAFDLFDPRRFNSPIMMSHLSAVCFVFVHSADPALDGLMVRVVKLEGESALKFNTNTLLYLCELDMRYYLVHWMVDFLAWVKHFFLPELHYWEWDENQGASMYDAFDPNDRRARDEIFQYLRQAFIDEAEGWKGACRIPRELLNAKENPADSSGSTDWLDQADELFDLRAQQEKRRRNHST